jgi:hypothetical protein
MLADPNKTILVDADGVLLDWVYSYRGWMHRHGYTEDNVHEYSMKKRYDLGEEEARRLCRMFNESAWIRKIPPLRDAVQYVNKLHREHGYVFHVISSLSDDEYAQHLRTKNLMELFGKTIFERYTYLDTGADKHEALELYRDSGCLWIEDKPENADLGYSMGLEPLLMSHSHNKNYEGPAKKVANWKEIYNHIVGE